MKKLIKNFLNKIPYIKGLRSHYSLFQKNSCFPPGHYYSPIVSVDEIKEREEQIWEAIDSPQVMGVDLNVTRQKELLGQLSTYYSDLPFKEDKTQGLRYFFENDMYLYTDGIVLYSLMRNLKPKQIIEVGSGYSSALMLDVNQRYFDNSIQLNFIEPYPERLLKNIREEDKRTSTILKKKVQEVDVSFFEKLNGGDILFIDSTHVSKTGSDVNYIFFEILPILKKGVWIHFHDIFYPFEYPKSWVYEGRNWNENYMLRAFLMNNEDYRIQLFSHYMHLHHEEYFKDMPLTFKNKGGNIWLQKVN